MAITGRLSDLCPNGISCPRIHDTDGDHVIVQGDRVTDPDVIEAVGGLPDHEGLVAVPRTLIHPSSMDVDELTEWIFARFTHDLLRIETRREYLVDSDGDDVARHLRGEPPVAEAKAAWLRTLAEHTAAGRHWRRLHVLPDGEPLTPYEDYEFHAFVDNVAAGEDVRICEMAAGGLDGVPDFFVVGGVYVVRSIYDEDGRHRGGQVVHGPDAAAYRALAAATWHGSEPFEAWWERHPQYHRAFRAA